MLIFFSYDNYFHFSNCARSTFASVSCRGLVTFQELWNGISTACITRLTFHTGRTVERRDINLSEPGLLKLLSLVYFSCFLPWLAFCRHLTAGFLWWFSD